MSNSCSSSSFSLPTTKLSNQTKLSEWWQLLVEWSWDWCVCVCVCITNNYYNNNSVPFCGVSSQLTLLLCPEQEVHPEHSPPCHYLLDLSVALPPDPSLGVRASLESTHTTSLTGRQTHMGWSTAPPVRWSLKASLTVCVWIRAHTCLIYGII